MIREQVNYIMWITGLPRKLARKVKSLTINKKGQFTAKLKIKVNVSDWKMVSGSCEPQKKGVGR